MVAVAVSDQQGAQIGYGQAQRLQGCIDAPHGDTGVNEDMCAAGTDKGRVA